MNDSFAFSLSNLSFSYPHSQPILSNISFELTKGDILVLLGRNGAGKSTLLNCIMGHLHQYSGHVLINNIDMRTLSKKRLASIIGYVPQLSDSNIDYSLLDFMLMGFAPKMHYFETPSDQMNREVVNVLSQFGLNEMVNRPISSLSGGERQLAYIARALIQKVELLILDEPTSALDYGNTRKLIFLLQRLRDTGMTTVFSCHNPDIPLMIQNSKTLVLLPKGEFLFDSTDKLLTSDLLSNLYGVPIEKYYIHEKERYICL